VFISPISLARIFRAVDNGFVIHSVIDSSIPSCSTNVCGDRLHSTTAELDISFTIDFSSLYCFFHSTNCFVPIDFSTIVSILSESSCTHFTSAEYESVPASQERMSFHISVWNTFFALKASCKLRGFFVMFAKFSSDLYAQDSFSTSFQSVFEIFSSVPTDGVSVHSAFSTAFPIFPHTSSRLAMTVFAESSSVSIFHLIFHVLT